ncbi:hypothetical protein BGZ79_002302 [Entomortierella chlamydospora]|nr:hypothetical protein BGZ79_002302 [Entomortierella chlamydospora]
MAMHQQQDLKGSVAPPASVNGGIVSAPQKSSNSMHSPAKFIKSDKRPSFSITLPPSCSRNLNNSSVYAMGDADSSTGSSITFSDQTIVSELRRPSVHFTSEEENREGKQGLPKTPYPTTKEEDERIQNLFNN